MNSSKSKIRQFIHRIFFFGNITFSNLFWRYLTNNRWINRQIRIIIHPRNKTTIDERRNTLHIRSPWHNGSRLFSANSDWHVGQLPIFRSSIHSNLNFHLFHIERLTDFFKKWKKRIWSNLSNVRERENTDERTTQWLTFFFVSRQKMKNTKDWLEKVYASTSLYQNERKQIRSHNRLLRSLLYNQPYLYTIISFLFNHILYSIGEREKKTLVISISICTYLSFLTKITSLINSDSTGRAIWGKRSETMCSIILQINTCYSNLWSYIHLRFYRIITSNLSDVESPQSMIHWSVIFIFSFLRAKRK